MRFDELYSKAIEKYSNKTPSSSKAYTEAKKYMTGGETRSIVFFNPYPLTIDYGKGAYLYDLDGNKYIDFLNNYTSMIHGHANPNILEAAHKAIDKGVCYGSAIGEQVELAKMLCERVPSFERVRFCNSGTEAVLFAIRAANAYTGKSAIIKMEGCFHGSIDLVEHSIAPKLPHPEGDAPYQAYPDVMGISENVTKDVYIAQFNNADSVEDILKEHADKISAIILEPVMGQTGAIAAKKEFIVRLRELADTYKVVLIFDEIQCLRVSYHGAQGMYKVTPDMTTVGKWIGGGYPIAAFGGKKEIMDVYNPQRPEYIAQSGTFNGNKLGMAAGIVSMRLLSEEAVDYINGLAEELCSGITGSIKKYNLPVSVACAGSLMHIHFTKNVPTDYASTKNKYSDYNKLLHIMLLEKGIFAAPRGSMNISTVMTHEDIQRAVMAYDEVFNEIKNIF